MTTRDAATYVFCLVQSGKAPSLRGVPGSVPGAGAPRLISIDRDVWAVVADAPLERFSGERLEHELQDVEAISRHAVAHASVIEFFFRRAPVIPLKLFTLFSTDERVLAHLQSRRARLVKLFAALRGLEEWGVRIIAGEVEAEAATSLKSGRNYLQIKKRLHDQNARPPRATVTAVNAAFRSLTRLAFRVRRESFPPPSRGRPFVSGGSFLVKATKRGEWKKAVTALSAVLERQGHRLEMSGPWPPYHFVSK
jgi:hypothetical protein